MNLPNTSPLRLPMLGRTHPEQEEEGGRGNEEGRKEERLWEVKARKEIRVRRDRNFMKWVHLGGLWAAGWKVWACGLGIYALLTFLFLPPSALDEELTLQQWVKENEGILVEEYQQRRKLAHTTCQNYEVYMEQNEYIRRSDLSPRKLQYSDWLTLKRVNWNNMYYVPGEDMVYCKVPKSGSSTWVYNLLRLAGAPEENIKSDIGLHRLVRDYYPKMHTSHMKKVFKKSFKFVVVRHPFERILSAYRDKLENYQRDLMFRDGFYHTMYGKNIVKVYRDDNDRSLANRTEPTWIEFVRYVINTPSSKFDEHWRPIYSLCSPCVVKYDVIAKMETFSEDTQYIINKVGLQNVLHVEWIHKTASDKTSDVALKYFSQLTVNQVDQLYEKYRLDFDLFGYDYDDYREMAVT